MGPCQKGLAWSRRSGTHLSLNLQSELGQRLPESSSVSFSATVSLITEIRYSNGTLLHVAAASEPRGSLFILP